jgi:curved DNA-binding protein
MGIAQKVTNSGPEQATKSTEAAPLRSVSVIEVSLSLKEAVFGVKKAIEIPDPTGPRKLSVTIPPGVRSGSVVRLRSKSNPGEDLVLIVRLATHPFLSIQARGLVAEIPVSVLEAHAGASISVPTLDEPVSVKIPAGSQSGSEIRLRNRGIPLKNGDRGDLFIRLLIKIPDSVGAVGLKEHFAALDQYYSSAVRNGLPKTLLD